MEFLLKIKEYLHNNKDWIFSGIGVVVIAPVLAYALSLLKKIFRKRQLEIKVIETGINHFLRREEINVYTSRSEFDDYITYTVNQAKKHIILVSITFGFVSYPKLEKLIKDRNIIFDFYVLDSTSQHFKNRINDINKSNNNDYLFNEDIDALIRLNEKYKDKLNVYRYDSYPFWHYILIDDKKFFLSHHPLNSLGYENCSVLEVDKMTSSDTFKLFFDHLEVIKKESKKYEKV